MLDQLRTRGYEIESYSHAPAILSADFPTALKELETALSDFTIPITEIVGSGGGETPGTQRLRNRLRNLGWDKGVFTIEKTINGVPHESTTHEIDHVRRHQNGVVVLEIEWNNKDPFFDRDLENFKRLHAEGAISMGIIITRGASLQERMLNLVRDFARDRITSKEALEMLGYRPTRRQLREIEKRTRRQIPLEFSDAWAEQYVSDKYGAATTHWRKLKQRIDRGVGHPCPLVLIGIPYQIIDMAVPIGSEIHLAEIEEPDSAD